MSAESPRNPILVILDTNVLVSALLSRSEDAPPVRILAAVRDGRLKPVLTTPILDEYGEALHRPRLRARHGLAPSEIDVVLRTLAQVAFWTASTDADSVPPDPDDLHIWSAWNMVPEACVITGDGPLLEFVASRGLALSPREFVDRWLNSP